MGESRCKWVVVEHLKFISSLLGLHALAIDYRGFADSSGSPTETGLCTDAAAGVQWLCEHGGMRPDEVVVWAHSLGTGVAVRLALALQAKDTPLRALILESPYLSLRLAAMKHPASLAYRALPFGNWLVYSLWRGRDELNTKMRIGDLELPMLLLHGTDDIMLPIQHGQTLNSLLSERDPRVQLVAPHAFVPLEKGGHLDSIFHEATLPSILDFLHGRSGRAKAALAPDRKPPTDTLPLADVEYL